MVALSKCPCERHLILCSVFRLIFFSFIRSSLKTTTNGGQVGRTFVTSRYEGSDPIPSGQSGIGFQFTVSSHSGLGPRPNTWDRTRTLIFQPLVLWPRLPVLFDRGVGFMDYRSELISLNPCLAQTR